MDTTTVNRPEMPPRTGKVLALGEVKWFAGINGKTGGENDYGFISLPGGDVYFHRSQSLSPPGSLEPGTRVTFFHAKGRKGKPAAEAVRVLSLMPDPELIAMLRDSENLPPQDVLTILLCRDVLPPCENEALRAVTALRATGSAQEALGRFWAKFPPASPKDPFFPHAPDVLKAKVCKRHYSEFRERLLGLFSSVTALETSLEAEAIYSELDERDEKIATLWAGRDDYQALLAKMLSARGAEKAAKKFYERNGSIVEDVSIRQLDGGFGDWTTHDLLVDSSVAVDVKNARRPVFGKKFYVEHTVARFKLDRRNTHVRIAGILSPYLNYEKIRDPANAGFSVDDLVFLGETGRDSVDRLVSAFGSPTFEVVRAYERTVPHWVFGYPPAWYRAFSEDVRRFVGGCEWPEGDEWEHVLDDSEKARAVPALCAAGKPLPAAISARLHDWQSDFYARVQDLSGDSPDLPVVFLAVLTDFLEKLQGGYPDFSPEDYLPMLYAEMPPSERVSYPLGAIDPLGLVYGLVKTLAVLWDNRGKTKLKNLSCFRFSGLGILQGRERDRREWKTVLAYCGGIAYQMDAEGKVLLDEDGRARSEKGKCGNAPLVIGVHANCPSCGKLMCRKCGFCSQPCQEREFAKRAAEAKAEAERMRSEQARSRATRGFTGMDGIDSRWEEIPLEAYEDDFRRR